MYTNKIIVLVQFSAMIESVGKSTSQLAKTI